MSRSTTPPGPYFIVFEGLDGSGKSTTAKLCAEALAAEYMTTPSPALRRLRQTVLDDLGPCQEARQLFYMSTVFAASRKASAIVSQGRSVVLDRYYLSTQAYAEFRASALNLDDLARQLRPADLTVMLDAPLAIRRQRVFARGSSSADLETLDAEADARLRELHQRRRDLPVIGDWLVVDSEANSPEACVRRVLDHLAR
jgi:dTMP kinase